MNSSALSFPTPRKALDKIPEHLLPYTSQQNPQAYSAIDNAVWRFIMKIASDFFAETAHKKYLEGLAETGISVERIPLVSEMDERLKKIGWRAVGVSGFIPPAVFLEFLALGIMPIACEIRKLENIAYTPSPDIVHEAAGHAPIVADPHYNEYVRAYGEVAIKAIFSKKDMNLYEAIKALSDIKEKPTSTQDEIDRAQKNFEKAFASNDYLSEATELSRMAWWTIEYGLVGDPNNFKLYGAGLLSSLGESYHCFDPNVVKVPLTEDCVNMSFDITRPQPQLYIATSFEEATKVLERYASTMAYRIGGVLGLSKARIAENTCTAQLEDDLQISGVVKNFGVHGDSEITFFDIEAPLQLCTKDKEIRNFEMKTLPEKFKVILSAFERGTEFEEGHNLSLQSKYGIKIEGKVHKKIPFGKSFCLWVKNQNQDYLLSSAQKVPSVFGGPADRAIFIAATWDGSYSSTPHVSQVTSEQKELNELYQKIRKMREKDFNVNELSTVFEALQKKYPHDWLLRYEIIELSLMKKVQNKDFPQLAAELKNLRSINDIHKELIDRGLRYLEKTYKTQI
jgi:phenylalanine-4-hydroxylase